jgi:copper chaperone CopZ
MKTQSLCLLASLIVMAGCSRASKTEPNHTQTTNAPALLTTNLFPGQGAFRFAIAGMTCEGCAGGLRSELLAATGVQAAEVSLKAAQAVVICDTNRTGRAQLLKVIKEAGFEGKPMSP